jgi:transcription elongation factor GreA
MNKHPITPQGFTALQEDLHKIKSVDRKEIIAAIDEARKQGDLSENAEYSAAKEKQSFIEGRIQTLESFLSYAEVINPKEVFDGETVIFGVTVVLLDKNSKQEVKYSIVGEYEANVDSNKISIMTPLARALIGKKIDDEVTLILPNGAKIKYEITDVFC